jgi:serine protease Do
MPRRPVSTLATALLILATATIPSPGVADSPPAAAADPAIERVLAKVFPALVRIDVVMVEGEDGRLNKRQGAGSGVVITPAGHVVTNHHVAGRARHLVCRMPDGEEIDATLVGTDPLADIAVIKLDLASRRAGARPLAVAAFGDSDRVRVGDRVFALGSPAAVSQSVTSGIVSNTSMVLPELFWFMRMKLDGEDVGELVRWIAHDAVIFGGNSGGPLVNAAGEIVGINEIGLASLGGAVPGNLAKSVADQLIATGRVTRSWIGLEAQPLLKGSREPRGVLVAGVIQGSPADAAGIRAGDIVVSVNGQAVNCPIPDDLPLFNAVLLGLPVGKPATLVIRPAATPGAEKTVTVTTIARDRTVADDEEVRSWGMTARDFTRMSALEHRRPDTRGVQVDSVRKGGPCADARPPIVAGDVIVSVADKPIDSLEALRKVSRELTAGQSEMVPVVVGFERKKARYLTVVKIGREPPEEIAGVARKPWFPAATQVLTRELAEALKLPGQKGVRVTEVFPGRAAERAGLQVGDILHAFDGEPIEATRVEDATVFEKMIQRRKIGDTVKLSGVRAGQPLELAVVLEPPMKAAVELPRHKDEHFELTIRDLSFDDRTAKQVGDAISGVFVERVEPAGWASLAKLALDDLIVSIDGTPTPDVATARKLLATAAEEKRRRLVFFVRRGIHSLFLECEPAWDGRPHD